ncbi:hypothetical protein EI94DRAFT_1716719 [Lactarius quietus]|nr:hypothetical protein EI94DRAFT_1716719 [Lactarius quietus]
MRAANIFFVAPSQFVLGIPNPSSLTTTAIIALLETMQVLYQLLPPLNTLISLAGDILGHRHGSIAVAMHEHSTFPLPQDKFDGQTSELPQNVLPTFSSILHLVPIRFSLHSRPQVTQERLRRQGGRLHISTSR